MPMNIKPVMEARALDIVRRIRGGEHPEDDRVDCKLSLPEGHAAARRIAAQLNAMYGEPILWLEGIDAKTGSVGPVAQDLQAWWKTVEQCFEPPAPTLDALLITENELRLRALQFSPNALPMQVRNPNHGRMKGDPAEWEVPWREGDMTRSARRSDLLRLLYPVHRAPLVERIAMHAQLRGRGDRELGYLEASALLYMVPMGSESVVVPFHLCEAWIGVDPESLRPLRLRTLAPRTIRRTDSNGSNYEESLNPRVVLTPDDVQVATPALLRALANGEGIPPDDPLRSSETLVMELQLHFVGSSQESRLRANLSRVAGGRRNDILESWSMGRTDLMWP
jgi:hypothetical protein